MTTFGSLVSMFLFYYFFRGAFWVEATAMYRSHGQQTEGTWPATSKLTIHETQWLSDDREKQFSRTLL